MAETEVGKQLSAIEAKRVITKVRDSGNKDVRTLVLAFILLRELLLWSTGAHAGEAHVFVTVKASFYRDGAIDSIQHHTTSSSYCNGSNHRDTRAFCQTN
eukprot:6054981-Pyramimonas_sp.AAC.3